MSEIVASSKLVPSLVGSTMVMSSSVEWSSYHPEEVKLRSTAEVGEVGQRKGNPQFTNNKARVARHRRRSEGG